MRIEHPVLGEGVLFKTKSGNYWGIETESAGQPFLLSINTIDEQPPNDQQVAFFLRFARSHDAAFEIAAPLLVPEYERLIRMSFPTQWREAFQFVAMTVPLAADERLDWDLSFECLQDNDCHHFNCLIQGGRVVDLQIDG